MQIRGPQHPDTFKNVHWQAALAGPFGLCSLDDTSAQALDAWRFFGTWHQLSLENLSILSENDAGCLPSTVTR